MFWTFDIANEQGKFGSTLTTWALSNEPYTFSEAFSSLECKKLDLTRGNAEWVSFFLLLASYYFVLRHSEYLY